MMINWLKKILAAREEPLRTNAISEPHVGLLEQADSSHANADLKQRGNAYLAQGDLASAAECYQTVLSTEPDNVDAHVNFGFACCELSRYEEAEKSLTHAIRITPNQVDAHYILGNVHQQRRSFEAAAASYRKVLELKSDFELAYRNLCYVLFESGQFAEAKSIILKGLTVNPDAAEFHYFLGNLYCGEKNFDQAITSYKKALAIQPEYAEVHYNLGKVFKRAARFNEALASFQQAIALAPHNAETHAELGDIFNGQGKFDEAVACYERALAMKPDYVEARLNLGNLRRAKGNVNEAMSCYLAALALRPDYVEAHLNIGNIYKEQGRLADALASYQQALTINPDYVEAHVNAGTILKEQDRLDDAIASYKRALAIDGNFVDAYSNLGIALHTQRRFEEASDCYKTALAINPHHANSHWNQSLLALVMGDFAAGWPGYEYRWKRTDADPQPQFKQPIWLGDADLSGKAILLYSEQGFGDTMQFVRYVEQLIGMGAKVYLEIPPALTSLFTLIPNIAGVFAKGERLPAFDFHCPIVSLPLAFKTKLASIPATVPYLRAPADRVAYWAEQLQGASAPRIGLVWSGNAKHVNDRKRSITLAMLSSLWSCNGRRYYSLQKEIRPADMALLRDIPEIIDLSSQFADFSDTAAAIANLDLVITVDTSVAHLAGALGKPVWILLTFIPDFRWLMDRTDSPWYPSARLFRQPSSGDWASVIEEVRTALDERYAES